MSLFAVRDRILLEGFLPERALLRLKREGICLFNVKKVEKNQILFSVSRKDSEKVFAIYPNVCYNSVGHTSFIARKIRTEGVARYVENAKKRVGLLVGGLLSFALLLYANTFVFSIDFVGFTIYQREVYMALHEGGIRPFSPYRPEKVDWICSKLLALDGVEYCSVQKKGMRAVVELRFSPFTKDTLNKESMLAKHTGTLLSLTVLRGAARVEIGETVLEGALLVENVLDVGEEGHVRVEPIARAHIGCVFSSEIEANSEEEAFAAAYLQLALSENDKLSKHSVTPLTAGLYRVEMEYIAVETINL